MRLNTIKTPNSTSYYVIKDYKRNGKWTTKVVEKLGTHEELLEKCGDLDPVAWANAYISELRQKEEHCQFEYVFRCSSAKQLEKNKQRKFKGGYLFLQSLYYRSGLHKICKIIEKDHEFACSLSDILNMLVTARIIDPSPRRSSLSIVHEYIEQPDYPSHEIKQALEMLAQSKDLLQAKLYKYSKKITQHNDSALIYDCTSYCFSNEADSMDNNDPNDGHCRNLIIHMGLFMDAEGIPLAFRLSADIENIQPSLKPVERKILSDFKHAPFIVCTDAGLSTPEIEMFIDEGQRKNIVIQPVNELKQHLLEWALDSKGWMISPDSTLYNLSEIDCTAEDERNRIYYKSCQIMENGIEHQLIVMFSPEVEKFIKPMKEIRFNYNEKSYCDGYYAVCTDLADAPPDIITVVKGRWESEAFFNLLKSEIKENPLLQKKDDLISAHFLTYFIALFIYRILIKKIRSRLPEEKPGGLAIVNTLRDMDFIEKEGDGYIPTYTRTAITDALHDAFGFRTDFELIPLNEMKKIDRMTKREK